MKIEYWLGTILAIIILMYTVTSVLPGFMERDVDWAVNGSTVGTEPGASMAGGTGLLVSAADNAPEDRVDYTFMLSATYRLPQTCAPNQLPYWTGSGYGCTSRSAFTTITTPAGSSPVADTHNDTLTLANGTGINISGTSTTDTIGIEIDEPYRLPQTCSAGQSVVYNSVTGEYDCISYPRAATKVVCAANVGEIGQCDYLCDGIDDQLEIQAAIDDLPEPGGRVLMSEGYFTTTADVMIERYDVLIQGMGWGRIQSPASGNSSRGTLIMTTAAINVFNIPKIAFRQSGIGFRDLSIECVTSTASTAIYAEHVDQLSADYVHAQFCNKAIQLIESDAAHLDHLSLLWNGETGLYLGSKTNYTKTTNSEISDGDNVSGHYGILVEEAHNNRFDNITAVRNRVNVGFINAVANTFTNSTIALAHLNGFWMRSASYYNSIYSNNILNNNTDGIVGGAGIAFAGTTPSSKCTYIYDNLIADIPMTTPYLDGWQHTTPTQQYGVIEGGGGQVVTGNLIYDNHLFGNTVADIVLTGATSTAWGNDGWAAYIKEVAGSFVLNEYSDDVDIRFESDGKTHAFYMDGATGNISLATSTSAYNLTVFEPSANAARIQLGNTESVDGGSYVAENNGILFISTGENSTRLALQNEGGATSIGGNLYIGHSTAPATGSDSITIKDGTAPTGLGADTAGIYADNVGTTTEMFVIDEGGAITQISPHDSEGQWTYYSCNIYTGVCVRIHLAEMIADIEALLGKSYTEISPLNENAKSDWWEDQERRYQIAAKEHSQGWNDFLNGGTDPIPQPYVCQTPPQWMQDQGVPATPADKNYCGGKYK